MPQLTLLVLLVLAVLPCSSALSQDAAGLPKKHTTRDVEGWTVRVDDRLLSGKHQAKGERAIKLLSARLVAIDVVMPETSLKKLRRIVIQLDLDHGELTAMQYHPSQGWLKRNGYDEALGKCVHIPSVDSFLSPYENHRMPWAVLHELAHAYHDQFLGFDNARIKAVWDKFKENESYQSVLTSPGHRREHYALTNPKEFFAEMTECYFGSNDFYPFVAGELKQDEPEVFALMQEMWGKLPGRNEH